MKMNRFRALAIVGTFASAFLLVSCGRGEQAQSDRDSADSVINDSVPSSGENEYQNDLQPAGTPQQLDSTTDTVNRKP
jgi:hypothetical protein